MRETLAVFRKELRSLFVSPIPYLGAIVFSAFMTWFVFEKQIFLVLRQANLDSLFGLLPIVMAVVVPAIAMRMWSEEIRGETIETLMTSPVRVRHLVAGKFLAAMVVVALCLAATAALPVTVSVLGDIDTGPMLGGYLGALLLGGAYLSIGLWLSSKTRNQIVAFLVGVVACIVLALVGQIGSSATGGDLQRFLSSICARDRFDAIARGVVDLRDVAYFGSIIAFFLYLNVESVENRRHA